jgi:beta-N-acetylhexosaminidase
VPAAAILGCAGPRLTRDERAFLADADPLGFILFKRNVKNAAQVRALVDELRAAVGRADAPVLIDQEGGRVQRLQPPAWRAAPAPARFGALAARDPELAKTAAWTNARLLAHELADLGLTVDCLPCLDLPGPGAHDVIGDRAFAEDPDTVAALGRAVCDGLLAGGVLPTVKHIPGHGRATVDSHAALPRVEAAHGALAAHDFAPFRALADQPWAMTAHVLYTALDSERPATTSPTVIDGTIRGAIGFDGVLVTDDLSMKALGGGFRDRAEAALAAGCDLVLHCNGDRLEMEAVMQGTGALQGRAAERVAAAEARRIATVSDADPAELTRRLDDLLAGA